MGIPKYDEMYREFLECLQDREVHSSKEVKSILAQKFRVTEEEKRIMLPSGNQPVFDNRVGWTRTYLKKAGLIDTTTRGNYCLTDAGAKVLQENPQKIDNHYLQRYETFRTFFIREGQNDADSSPRGDSQQQSQTPQDILESVCKQLDESLADDILTEILNQTPDFFERLVVKLLVGMGYGGTLEDSGRVTGQTGDEGLDGVVREDKLGFDRIYIQAKRWEREKVIGRPEIQRFVGALAGQGANKGLFITTAKYSKDAMAYANKQHTTKVVLVDGAQLAKLMIECDLGVATENVYKVKKIDTDFFNDI